MSSPQLTLGIRLNDRASFANYFTGRNAEVLNHLRACARGDSHLPVLVWSGPGCGKTHLLHAACHAASARAEHPVYLPMRDAALWSPEVLEGLEQAALVCIDDVDAVAGLPAWEEALFHLYNRMSEQRHGLLLSAAAPPGELKLKLPDLASRLAWGLVLHLEALDENDKLGALQLRAQQRGLELPADVAQFLLRRCPRDLPSLFALLDRLDQASLAAHRKLTIPFVREFI